MTGPERIEAEYGHEPWLAVLRSELKRPGWHDTDDGMRRNETCPLTSCYGSHFNCWEGAAETLRVPDEVAHTIACAADGESGDWREWMLAQMEQ